VSKSHNNSFQYCDPKLLEVEDIRLDQLAITLGGDGVRVRTKSVRFVLFIRFASPISANTLQERTARGTSGGVEATRSVSACKNTTAADRALSSFR
jgi:hypothetical protein